jgi:hypothetical protein
MMMKRFRALLATALLAAACATNKPALYASRDNAVLIKSVRIGQTMDEVRAAMHKGPESQSERVLPDGTREAVWNYVTDYKSDSNTAITFWAGKVSAIDHTRWAGEGDFSHRGTTTEAARERIDRDVIPGVTVTFVEVTGKADMVASVRGECRDAESIAAFVGRLKADRFFRSVTVVSLYPERRPRRFELQLSLEN